MSTVARGAGLTVAVVIGISLFGPTGLAGPIGLAIVLITVLAFLVRQARPTVRSSTRGKARSIRFLPRYKPVDGPTTLPGIFLAGLAVWTALDYFGARSGEALSVALLVPVLLYVVNAQLAAAVFAAAGILGSMAEVFTSPPEDVGDASAYTQIVFFGILAAVLVAASIVRIGLGPLGRIGFGKVGGMPLGRAEWLLFTFGLVEIVAFVTAPAGVDTWSATSWSTRAAILALVLLLSILGGYAPKLLLSLVAVGAFVGEVALIAADSSATAEQSDLALGYVLAFGLLTYIGLAIRPGSHKVAA
jgi:hypothetical protein